MFQIWQSQEREQRDEGLRLGESSFLLFDDDHSDDDLDSDAWDLMKVVKWMMFFYVKWDEESFYFFVIFSFISEINVKEKEESDNFEESYVQE